METSLFYRAEGYSIGEVVFDLLLDESHALENIVTSHNVEDGSVISDHIKNKLRSGSLTGAIYNYTINQSGLVGNRALTVFDTLKQLWRDRTTVKIVTTLDIYDSVAIGSVVPTREEAGEVIEFTITFQEIKTVTLTQTSITASVHPLKMETDLDKQAAPKLDVGRQVGTGT